jgi:hypothetical protein
MMAIANGCCEMFVGCVGRKQFSKCLVTATALCFPIFSFGQNNNITNTGNTTLVAAAAFGTLTPGTSLTPASTQVQFLLRSKNSTGYRVDGQASFTTTLQAITAGGATAAAADIGVGITSIAAASGVIQPRTDTISTGFNYDPGAVSAVNGLTPFQGAASGQATLADLAVSTKILSGGKINGNINTNSGTNYLTVTMKFAVVPQYFTPANFSSVVTLTISNGP